MGLYLSDQEGTHHWLSVLTDLNNRNVKDILIACVDGLKGFPEVIETIYPNTEIQHCVNHQICNSMKYFASKNQKVFMTYLKCIYKAATLSASEASLDELEAKCGDKYPMVIKSWRSKWPTRYRPVISSFESSPQPKAVLPTKNRLLKSLYASILKMSEHWTHPVQNWNLNLSTGYNLEGRLEQHLAL